MREELLRIAESMADGLLDSLWKELGTQSSLYKEALEVQKEIIALAERVAAGGELVTDVGTWLCGKLMEHCRASGLTPATQNKLFALCDEARKTFPPSQPVADRCRCLPDGLVERCREVIGWQRTGLLNGDALRTLAASIDDEDDGIALQRAEEQTKREAMQFVLAAAPEVPRG